MEQDYEEVAKTSWGRSANKPFYQKTEYLAADLKNGVEPNLSFRIS